MYVFVGRVLLVLLQKLNEVLIRVFEHRLAQGETVFLRWVVLVQSQAFTDAGRYLTFVL